MVLDLFGFMASYAVVSCHRVTSSIYVFLLMVECLYVIPCAHSLLLKNVAWMDVLHRPCM